MQKEKIERNQLFATVAYSLRLYSKTNRWIGYREVPSKPRLGMEKQIIGSKAMGKKNL